MGGVLRMNVNDRSSKTVISTGTIVPGWLRSAALYCLQKSMIATPWGPSAVPTGGAGVACPGGDLDLDDGRDLLLGHEPAAPTSGHHGDGHSLYGAEPTAWRPG